MSFFFRKRVPSPVPVEQEYKAEWRQGPWSKREEMEQKLCDFKICPKVQQLRFLLFGPIGAGKSSFINSVRTTFQGYNCVGAIACLASAEGMGNSSCTLQLRSYNLKNGKDKPVLPFVMMDTMGVEGVELNGVHTSDIIRTLQGRIKKGYNFNPCSAMTKKDLHYNSKPTLNDRIHCLVCVLPADKISLFDDNIPRKMKLVLRKAQDFGIPQVIIMTMVDKICPLVKDDLKKVYTSMKIKTKMEECSTRLGVPMNCIFPVKCYSEEVEPKLEIDALILMALTNIVNFANDCVEDQSDKEEEDEED